MVWVVSSPHRMKRKAIYISAHARCGYALKLGGFSAWGPISEFTLLHIAYGVARKLEVGGYLIVISN